LFTHHGLLRAIGPVILPLDLGNRGRTFAPVATIFTINPGDRRPVRAAQSLIGKPHRGTLSPFHILPRFRDHFLDRGHDPVTSLPLNRITPLRSVAAGMKVCVAKVQRRKTFRIADHRRPLHRVGCSPRFKPRAVHRNPLPLTIPRHADLATVPDIHDICTRNTNLAVALHVAAVRPS
jgi:hypothetical protein